MVACMVDRRRRKAEDPLFRPPSLLPEGVAVTGCETGNLIDNNRIARKGRGEEVS